MARFIDTEELKLKPGTVDQSSPRAERQSTAIRKVQDSLNGWAREIYRLKRDIETNPEFCKGLVAEQRSELVDFLWSARGHLHEASDMLEGEVIMLEESEADAEPDDEGDAIRQEMDAEGSGDMTLEGSAEFIPEG